MSEKIKILVVDDDAFTREIIEAVLSEDYGVISAKNGIEGLRLAQTQHPALVLLDVDMPDMDGYDTCRQLKQNELTAHLPVIFVSALDQLDERLKGYEVGGNDYVVKPFYPEELKAKIVYLLNKLSKQAKLKETANFASTTAMTAMTSMSEMGALLESLKKFNACVDECELAEATLFGLSLYGLCGVVQVRTPKLQLSLSEQGEATPLEVSVMNHMSTMDRIVHFKNKMSINYPHVGLLVNNMPVDDEDRCGRLRDHLAMLVEGADMRVTGIVAGHELRRRGLAIETMAERIGCALNEIDSTQRRNRMEMRLAFSELTDRLWNALNRVAITHEQEAYLYSIVTDGIEQIICVQSAEAELQDKLTCIIHELNELK